MTTETQQRKAQVFLALHRTPPMLVLPNVWDVVSARLFELEGFQAVGTTSAGIAATLGYPDGQRMSLTETTDVVRRIVQHVDIPVSADIEAGYAQDTKGVANAAKAVIDAGAVGVNLEDGTGDPAKPLVDPAVMVERIAAIRAMASWEGIQLVINARTDVYLTAADDPSRQFDDTVRRANVYAQAGADCVFVPDTGDLDRETIARLVREIDAPINIIAGMGTPPLGELEALGVARVSFGPRPMRAALALVRKMAREWKTTGTYETMVADALSYADVNRMFA